MLVGVVSFSLLPLSRVFARTEAGPEEDFGDHCDSCWVFAPARVLQSAWVMGNGALPERGGTAFSGGMLLG